MILKKKNWDLNSVIKINDGKRESVNAKSPIKKITESYIILQLITGNAMDLECKLRGGG